MNIVIIDDDIFVYKGVRILGLGGSMEYIPDSPNQYTEKMMRKRIHKLLVEAVAPQKALISL